MGSGLHRRKDFLITFGHQAGPELGQFQLLNCSCTVKHANRFAYTEDATGIGNRRGFPAEANTCRADIGLESSAVKEDGKRPPSKFIIRSTSRATTRCWENALHFIINSSRLLAGHATELLVRQGVLLHGRDIPKTMQRGAELVTAKLVSRAQTP